MVLSCEAHGPSPAVIVCIHVAAGAAVAHYVEPDARIGPDGAGELLCGACHAHQSPLTDLRLWCMDCVVTFLMTPRATV